MNEAINEFLGPKISKLKIKMDFFSSKYKEDELEAVCYKNFSAYYTSINDKYSRIQTVINENRQDLLSIYQESNLVYEPNSVRSEIVTNTVTNILKESSFSWISGYGGIGKSTMLKYFLLNAIKKNENIKLPVYIELKKYNRDTYREKSIPQFLFSEMKLFNFELEYDFFYEMIKTGSFLFLLDAFDEIETSLSNLFLEDISDFVNQHKNNEFIVTSRYMPSLNINGLGNCQEFKTEGLNEAQAIKLIEKLSFYDWDIRYEFIEKLKTDDLYNKYKSITQNPILLMLMLKNFGKSHNFPNELSDFFLSVFDLLAEDHDRTKIGGGFERKFKTDMTKSQLRDLFAKLCFTSYFQNRGVQREFTETDVLGLLRLPSDFAIKDLLHDFSVCLCLIYKESNRYYFVHNIFQEFYAAYYLYKKVGISKQSQFILDRLSNDDFRVIETTVNYYMELDKIENNNHYEDFIVLPFLELIEKTDGFISFDDYIFNKFSYSVKELDDRHFLKKDGSDEYMFEVDLYENISDKSLYNRTLLLKIILNNRWKIIQPKNDGHDEINNGNVQFTGFGFVIDEDVAKSDLTLLKKNLNLGEGLIKFKMKKDDFELYPKLLKRMKEIIPFYFVNVEEFKSEILDKKSNHDKMMEDILSI